MVKLALVFGVFDLLHDGHRAFVAQALQHAPQLVVVVACDSMVQRLKHKIPYETQEERMKKIRALAGIADVVAGDDVLGAYTIFKKYYPDLICLGYDQRALGTDLAQKMHEGLIPTIPLLYLKAYKPELYHTSLLHR
jgi:cytidyltransferase-like protein